MVYLLARMGSSLFSDFAFFFQEKQLRFLSFAVYASFSKAKGEPIGV